MAKYELTEGGDDKLKVTGTFYYGVVKVQGETNTYIMLDRNLGATDNSPYVPDINEFQKTKVPSVDTSRFQSMIRRIRITISSRGIYPLLYLLKALKYQINLSLRTWLMPVHLKQKRVKQLLENRIIVHP